jgi:hypothetical protein
MNKYYIWTDAKTTINCVNLTYTDSKFCDLYHILLCKIIVHIKLHLSLPPDRIILTTTERGPHGPADTTNK